MSDDVPEPIHVIVSMDFSKEIMDSLRAISDRYVFHQHFPDVPDSAYAKAEVLYTMSNFPAPAQAPNLRWIQTHFAGVDRVVDKPIVADTDVTVTTGSGIHAIQMAEYCLAMMLYFKYHLQEMRETQSQGEWVRDWPEQYDTPMLHGSTLGIVGYGSIGRELARIARSMGMTVLATKRDVMNPAEGADYVLEGHGDPEGNIPERIYPPEAVGSMASACDYLVITVPLTDQTRNMIDESVFKRMREHVVIVNVGRGGVVDEDALLDAMKSGKIGGAAFDVFATEPLPSDSPLWQQENLLISPHIAGSVPELNEQAATLFRENLQRFLDKRPLLNVVHREHGY